MTETRAGYNVPGRPKLRPGTLLRFTDPAYEAPTHEDLRALKELSGKTGGELSAIAGLQDSRTFRKWTAPPEANQRSQIPYAAWRLILIELGMVVVEQEVPSGWVAVANQEDTPNDSRPLDARKIRLRKNSRLKTTDCT